jgi:hypothetical protein
MPGKSDLFKEELDQLSDQEIDARLAAAVWVDDKRAAVLRYLEEKKLGRKKAEQSEELEIARSRGRMGGRGRGEGRTADGTKLALTIAGVAAAAAIAGAALAAVIAYLKP